MKRLEIVEKHFEELSSSYFKLDESSRGTSFKNSIDKIKEVFGDSDLPENVETLPKIKGVGPSSIQEIKEVLETGTSARLEELKKRLVGTEEQKDNVKAKLASLFGNKK